MSSNVLVAEGTDGGGEEIGRVIGNVPEIPDHLLEHFMQYFNTFHNETDDFHKAHLRRSVAYVYPLFIILYAIVVLMGTLSNIAVIVVIIRRRLYREPTYFFIVNLALSDIIKCILVLPATLAVLLIQNWIFGSFLCYFIPMMQDIPIHASMLTFVAIAVDRYRLIAYSTMASRLPRCLCTSGVWVLAVCVVLPYVFYIRYFDFEAILGPQVAGAVLCTINVEDDMEEYVRGMFICLYVLPLTIVAFFYVRIDGELKVRTSQLNSTNTATVLFEMSSTDERSTDSVIVSSPCPARSSWQSQRSSSQPEVINIKHSWPRHFDYDDDDFDVNKEKRTQKYLISMVTLFAMCLCPLKILGLAKHVTFETSDNTGNFDLAFITFVWIGFLSTCTTPVLFASWLMSRSTKDRLRGYFRFSNHGRQSMASTMSVSVQQNTCGGQNNEGYMSSSDHRIIDPNRLMVKMVGASTSRRRSEPQNDSRRHGQSRSKSII